MPTYQFQLKKYKKNSVVQTVDFLEIDLVEFSVNNKYLKVY